jgi:hypothetical protein
MLFGLCLCLSLATMKFGKILAVQKNMIKSMIKFVTENLPVSSDQDGGITA